MKTYKSKNDTMNETDIQRVYKYHIYPRDSKKYSVKDFVTIDFGRMGGSRWTCFVNKDNISYYFDSVGGTPDIFLMNQLTKPLVYHNYKIQDIKSNLCCSYCLYFFFLTERTKYNDAILKIIFDTKNAN